MSKPMNNMEWLVDKINRKLRMFLKTKDIGYLEKVDSILHDLRNEHDLWQSWKDPDEERERGKRKVSMFYNFIRWQCLNTKPIGEYQPGEITDEDDFTRQLMKLLYMKR